MAVAGGTAVARRVGGHVRRLWLREVHCLGDSHANAFKLVRLPKTRLDVLSVAGATALGLANPNSRTDAIGRYTAKLARIPRRDTVVFVLGEVDVGFLCWHPGRKGTPLDVARRSFETYTSFLERGVPHRLIVSTVGLPSITDYSTWAGLDNARRDVTASLAERTELTKEYSRWLRTWAAERDVGLLDVEAAVTGPDGLLDGRFVHPDPLDHHYNPEPYADLLAGLLAAVLSR